MSLDPRGPDFRLPDSRLSEVDCPDWRALAAEREELADAPPGWREALVHLDGCPRCRSEALAADPTLLFRRLPGAAPAGAVARGAEIAVDVEAMRRAVATLRRTGPLQAAPAVAEARSWRRRLSAVAAALLLASLLGLTTGGGPSPAVGDGETPPSGAGSVAATVSLFEAAGFGGAANAGPTASSIEEVDLPDSRAHLLATDELTVAILVSGSLDV